jgi:hypothetical protein
VEDNTVKISREMAAGTEEQQSRKKHTQKQSIGSAKPAQRCLAEGEANLAGRITWTVQWSI